MTRWPSVASGRSRRRTIRVWRLHGPRPGWPRSVLRSQASTCGLTKSVLAAPFRARLGARLADPGQTVAAGQSVLVLFDQAPPRVRVGVPDKLAQGLRLGDRTLIDVSGVPLESKILRIRPDLDPATRSRAVVLELSAGAPAAFGTTAELVLQQEISEPGFWAPLSALREGVRGSWSVMAIETTDAGDVVRGAAVEVIHSDGQRAFLRGLLPDGARIVAEAPDRVASGQSVSPLLSSLREY